MVRDGQISLADAKRVLRRYWWILLITIPPCIAAAAVAVKVLPKKYISQTVVLVDAPAISADIVKPVVPENLGSQLASMQQQILSRTRLEPVIEKFGLYQRERKKHTIDELVVRLRIDRSGSHGADGRDRKWKPSTARLHSKSHLR